MKTSAGRPSGKEGVGGAGALGNARTLEPVAMMADDTRDWRECVLDARAALANIDAAAVGSFAAQVRRAFAEISGVFMPASPA